MMHLFQSFIGWICAYNTKDTNVSWEGEGSSGMSVTYAKF